MISAAPYQDTIEHLGDELCRLDLLIRLRLARADLRNETDPQSQAARTVYIARDEVDWLLGSDPDAEGGVPDELLAALDRLSAEVDGRVAGSLADGIGLPLPVLGRLFGLSPMELQTVVVCLAPELRRKYDRLYAYLQDDITRKRPSVDLVLELLCPTERQRWTARAIFTESAPLLRFGILRKVDDPQSPSGSTGLAQFLVLDPRICQFLLGSDELDARMAGHARLYRPSEASEVPQAAPDLADGLLHLARHHLRPEVADRRKLVFALHGPAGVGKGELARQVCHGLGVSLLSVDAQAPDDQTGNVFRTAFREGLLQQAAVHLAGADALLRQPDGQSLASLASAIAELGWLVFLTAESDLTAGDGLGDAFEHAGGAAGAVLFQPVALSLPDVPRSTEIWQHSLAGHTPDPKPWAAELARRFRLSPGRIRAAVELADNNRLMQVQPPALTLSDVSAACRQQSNQKLGELAVKVRATSGWDDLVLPEDRVTHLRDICAQARHHYLVYGGWGFGAKLSHGKGLSVLFSGPPGTGKTMAAGVLARDLELDLYKVDLSGVVSKYIGETEKNLARIFDEAQTSNSILFFDEADALFGKRTEVSDAHDRYANIETSYLLQKMEEYEGVVILATNLRQNLDEAFTRRIRFVVEFPFPEADSRARIWRALFPPEAPVSADVDFGFLAREYPVAGGSIKNIVLNAAFLAAADGGVIDRRHILRGTRREFEKIGKLWSEPAPIGQSPATG